MILRELPNVTPFRVATFGRKTAPFPKMALADAHSGFSRRNVPQEERSNREGQTAKHAHVCAKARSSPEWFHTSDQSLLDIQRKSLDPEEISRDETRLEPVYRPAACPAVTPDTEKRPTSGQVKDYRRTGKTNSEWMFITCTTHTNISQSVPRCAGSAWLFSRACRCIVVRSASAHPCFNVCGFSQGDDVCGQSKK